MLLPRISKTLLSAVIILALNATGLAQDLADVIEQSEKSLVRIEVKGAEGGSLGSGFVVSEDGLMVTNVHVMAGAEKAIAIFPNNEKYEIVGTLHIDEGRDICVTKIRMARSIPIKLANGLPRKGETVTALGSPLGLSFTATTGIISAIRSGDDLGRDIGDSSMKGTWVQVDAALSPGNSGGPLINKKGEVVAMSTRASQGAAQNLNFGISIVDIKAAIRQAKTSRQIAFSDGVGKIKSHDVGGGGGEGPGSMVKRREIPASALDGYIQQGRESFKELAVDIRRKATESEKEWRLMKKGQEFIPANIDRGSSIVVGMGRTSKKYYFRSAAIKKRALKKKEEEKDELKKLKTAIGDSDKNKALHALLKNAGPVLDPQEASSVGFLSGAVVVHAFNDHDIIVGYDNTMFLMWVESTTGLSAGKELDPIPAFVAGTETVMVPGRSSMSVTVLQAVTERELEKAVLGNAPAKGYETWRDNTGKFTIIAKFIKNDGTHVHLLKKGDEKAIKVPLSRLDAESLKMATGR